MTHIHALIRFISPRLGLPRFIWLVATGLVLAGCQAENAKTPPPTLKEAVAQTAVPVERIFIRDTPVIGGLTPERINASPSLAGTALRQAKVAPSGEYVTVLQGRDDDAQQYDLWAYDLETGEGRKLVSSTDLVQDEILSEEEKNRRERAREYGRGIISYDWVGDGLLLFPLGGDIYLYDVNTQESRQVTKTEAFESDPQVSADGSVVAYVRENELYVTNLNTGQDRKLSSGATDTIRNATASFVVQEELDRNTGYWMAPDAKTIAYTQIDESKIAIENRLDFGADGVKNIAQRYPFTGTDNATVKLGFVPTTGGRTKWVELKAVDGSDDIYLTRVVWAPDNRHIFAGVLSRDHKTHTMWKIDSQTGQADDFYTETSPTWLNIGSDLQTTDTGFIWSAQRGDTRQVFDIAADGTATVLTPDTLNVRSLLCRTENTLFVSGWQDTPLSTHIFKVENNTATQISKSEGQHSANFNADCTRYLGYYNSDTTPPQVRAFTSDGEPLAWINENALDADHPFAPYRSAQITPEYGQLDAEDGTKLDYVLYKPADLKFGERRPAITIVYGGPGVQRVYNGWNRKYLAQMLAHHGFVVFQIDGRGASNRGKAFEDVLYRAMGRAEVVDQSVGAKWLASQDFVDPDRMGVYGWSYGGYMTLMMLGQTDYYASGVSGAPVTDWALYDTAYTERYLGHPDPENSNYTEGAYEEGSVFAHLDGLTEPVLLIHGMADDNVVFRHSIVLMDAMQKAGRHNMRIQTYPGEKHGFRTRENQVHRDRQILEFFSETLARDASEN